MENPLVLQFKWKRETAGASNDLPLGLLVYESSQLRSEGLAGYLDGGVYGDLILRVGRDGKVTSTQRT